MVNMLPGATAVISVASNFTVTLKGIVWPKIHTSRVQFRFFDVTTSQINDLLQTLAVAAFPAPAFKILPQRRPTAVVVNVPMTNGSA